MNALSFRRDAFQGYSRPQWRRSLISIKQAERSAQGDAQAETKAYLVSLIDSMSAETCLNVAFRIRQNRPHLTRKDAREVDSLALGRARTILKGTNEV